MSTKDDFRPKARRPRGFGDRRGAQLKREREIVERVLGVYEAWGFERLETAAFEYADALGKFLPDQDRPNEGVFSLQDDDEQWMALRYDLTAPLARFVAENYDALPKPYRRCAAGPVWRNEKPGPGRFREFWQCDADTVGSPTPAADAEMIAMACAALEAAGVARGSYVLGINTRQILDGVLEAAGLVGEDSAKKRVTVLRAIDKLDRLKSEGVIELLGKGRVDASGDFTPGAELSNQQIEIIEQYIELTSSWIGSTSPEVIEEHNRLGEVALRGLRSFGSIAFQDFGKTLHRLEDVVGNTRAGNAGLLTMETIVQTLRSLGIGAGRFNISPSIVRGLEYYTGAVFEAELLMDVKDEKGNLVRFGSVGGGGRYDDLVSRFKGQPIPATGFSVGVSRLAAALQYTEDQPTDGPVVLLPFDAEGMGECFALAAQLRAAGIVAEVYLGGAGPKAQLKYADKRRSPAALILGGDERAAGAITIKDLKQGLALSALAESDREAWKAAQGEIQKTVPQSEMLAAVRAILARRID